MACSLNVHPVDSTEIPFITEADDDSILVFSNRACCSRKFSFQDENIKRLPPDLAGNKRRISSLEELRLFNDHIVPEVLIREKRARRQPSQLRRKSSAYESCRRASVASNRSRRGSRRCSYSYPEYERRKSSASQSRRNSSMRSGRSLQQEMTPKQLEKEKRRRKVVFAVVATFLFILVCSVLAVVVTLTHQSEFTAENKTLTYYTFAPDAKIVILKSRYEMESNNSR